MQTLREITVRLADLQIFNILNKTYLLERFYLYKNAKRPLLKDISLAYFPLPPLRILQEASLLICHLLVM